MAEFFYEKSLDFVDVYVIIINVDGVCRQAVKTSDCGSDMHGFESHQTPHKKDFGICQGLFYLSDEDENPFEGSSEERAECGVLLRKE